MGMVGRRPSRKVSPEQTWNTAHILIFIPERIENSYLPGYGKIRSGWLIRPVNPRR